MTADALQYSLFADALPTRTGRAAEPAERPPRITPPPARTPAPVATKPAPALPAIAGLGGKVQPGDWVRLDPRTDKAARDFGLSAGHVEAVVDTRYPVPGLLLAYADREAPPTRWTHVLGGFRTPHPFDAVAEVWRPGPSGWSQVL
jgi:hypothetical protein